MKPTLYVDVHFERLINILEKLIDFQIFRKLQLSVILFFECRLPDIN